MYLMTAIRRDIAFAVSKTARAFHQPSISDWNNVKRIFKYLKGTANYDMTYRGLKVQSNADFAGDVKTRRSTSEVVALYAEGAVSWSSKLQRSVAFSTTEAEIITASEAIKEAVWLNRLIHELLCEDDQPILFIDSASAVKLAKNPEFNKRSKHIEVRHFYVQERYLDGTIDLHIDIKMKMIF